MDEIALMTPEHHGRSCNEVDFKFERPGETLH
jgi:hypothetical protein